MKQLIQTLTRMISDNPRVALVQKKILKQLDPNDPLREHQHIKILWYEDRFNQMLKGNYTNIMPVNIELVPSLDCNLHCPHCTYRLWKERTKSEENRRQMKEEDIAPLLVAIEEAGVRGVTVTGGGEPFVNSNTITLLKCASQKKFDTGVFTNGCLLDKDKISEIAELDLSFIRISINTADEATYLKFHAVKDPTIFRSMIDHVGKLGEALGKVNSKTNYGLAVVVNEDNVDEMLSVALLVRECFRKYKHFKLDYITYRPVVNYGQIDDNLNHQIAIATAKKAEENFQKTKEMLKDLPVRLKNANDYFYYASQATRELQRGYEECIGHAWCASVAYDGGVYLCSERDGELNYLMGNLKHASFSDIWQSKQRKEVVDHIKNCPPACKIHRTNLLLYSLLDNQTFDDNEIGEINIFLDVLRNAGQPEQLSFLSW